MSINLAWLASEQATNSKFISQNELDASALRRAMGRFASGVSVITSGSEGEIHAMTVNSLATVSFEPLMVMFCVSNKARMRETVVKNSFFAINILSQQQEDISQYFAGAKDSPIPSNVNFETLENVPVLSNCLSTVVCQLEQLIPAGDHQIVLGQVLALRYHEKEEQPLIYFRGRYRQLTQPSSNDMWREDDMRIYYQEW